MKKSLACAGVSEAAGLLLLLALCGVGGGDGGAKRGALGDGERGGGGGGRDGGGGGRDGGDDGGERGGGDGQVATVEMQQDELQGSG